MKDLINRKILVNHMKSKLIICGVMIILGLVGLFTLTSYLRLVALILISIGLILLIKFTFGRAPTAAQPQQPQYTDYTDRLT